MARIVVAGYGTAGDFVPLLALAERLRNRGHEVMAAVNPWAVPLFRNAGLVITEVGPRFGPDEAASHQHLFDPRNRWTAARAVEAANLMDWPRHYRELAQACRSHEAEVLVSGATLEPAGWLAEDVGIPWVRVFFGDPPPELISEQILPEAPHPYLPLFLSIGRSRSRSKGGVVARAGFPSSNDGGQPGWREPTPELRAFLGPVGRVDASRPRRWRDGPLVLLPGSTPLADPEAFLLPHAEAAAALGRRLVVQRGWAGLEPAMLTAGQEADHVFFAEILPHEWLLRRAAAAIVSGRPGTLARAQRGGCPVLVEPRGRDTYVNASVTQKMGLGAVLDPRHATAETVRRMLEERVMLEAVQRRCRRMAKRRAREDGTAEACDAIEAWLDRPEGKWGGGGLPARSHTIHG